MKKVTVVRDKRYCLGKQYQEKKENNWQGKSQISNQSKRQPLKKLMKYRTSLWKHNGAVKTLFLVLMVLKIEHL